jgi:thymidylate synthase
MKMLKHFDIIVAISDKGGIGKSGDIPWKNLGDSIHFQETTIGNGNNAVIMGRVTYESLPMGPLPKRRNIVVSSIVIPGTETVPSLLMALKLCTSCEKIFIIGGQQLYDEAIYRYGYLCDKILVSIIPGNYECDKIFPYEYVTQRAIKTKVDPRKSFQLVKLRMNEKHPEQQYLDLLREIIRIGDRRIDRTKIGTKSLFGQRMEFDLRNGFPLLTTKRTWFDGIKSELLFFISGKTDTKILEAQGINIWKGNTSKEYLESHNLQWREGDIGPGYSFQWRHAGTEYQGCDVDYSGKGIDQLQNVIDGIKTDPFGRRHIVSSWDVSKIHLMALPPCHCFFQFYVGSNPNGDPAYLDCVLYQRSADMFLGVPFNIASYALLIMMIGHLTQLIPRKFIHNLGDTHIYLNHINQATEQMKRIPYPFPTIRFSRTIHNINDFRTEDIILENYVSHGKLSGEMAI